MPILLAVLAWWIRLLRRPMDARLKYRSVGGSLMLVGGVGVGLLWDRSRPSGLNDAYVLGEIAGVLAVYLMAWSLLLATRWRSLERWFGGLDRMYLWHRRAAIAGMLLLVPHVLVTGGGAPAAHPANGVGLALGFVSALGLIGLVAISLPRVGRIVKIPYERWLFLHRLTGLFVLMGVTHGLVVDRVIASSGLLKVVYLVIGAVGLVSYGYDEILRRRLAPSADYTVSTVTRPADDIVELQLMPTGDAITPVAGQFVFVRIGGDNAWREHPFSIAASDPTGRLRLSVRSRGTDTRRMHDLLVPGLPATITGPYGMFDYTLGGHNQVWVAGGIGIVPFLGWLEALAPDDDIVVDLFCSVPTEADTVYEAELDRQGVRLPWLHLHHLYTRSEGHLTGTKITDAVEAPITEIHTFICGPLAMVKDLTRDLRRTGVPREYIHAEHFAFR